MPYDFPFTIRPLGAARPTAGFLLASDALHYLQRDPEWNRGDAFVICIRGDTYIIIDITQARTPEEFITLCYPHGRAI